MKREPSDNPWRRLPTFLFFFKWNSWCRTNLKENIQECVCEGCLVLLNSIYNPVFFDLINSYDYIIDIKQKQNHSIRKKCTDFTKFSASFPFMKDFFPFTGNHWILDQLVFLCHQQKVNYMTMKIVSSNISSGHCIFFCEGLFFKKNIPVNLIKRNSQHSHLRCFIHICFIILCIWQAKTFALNSLKK